MEIDWRMTGGFVAAEATLPSGHVAKAGDMFRVVTTTKLSRKSSLTIPVPNVVAMYIHASHSAWHEYCRLKKQSGISENSAKAEVFFLSDADAIDAVEKLSISVIMGYAAIESFCNESIPSDHKYWKAGPQETILLPTDSTTIYRRFSTSEKLCNVLPEIFGVASPKGGKGAAWESYRSLKDLRDGLIHAKPDETRPLWNNQNNLWAKMLKLKRPPHALGKNIFDWYLNNYKSPPGWYKRYPL
ncbi:hypothetical protein [Pseudohongiella acticola]|uniref:hypothetical protein n=1 Tax=Pseudohongiella acticola TaxID=1524254 RepID=UPI0030EC8C11